MNKKKIAAVVSGALLLVGFMILLRPWMHSPEAIPLGSQRIQLPDPAKLGTVLPAEPISPSGPRILAPSFKSQGTLHPEAPLPSASILKGSQQRQTASASRQKAPKAFTPPPEVVRQMKKEGSILY